MNAMIALGPLATVTVYLVFTRIHRRFRSVLTLPILATTLLMVGLLRIGGNDFDTYARATKPFFWLLGPATVALAVPFARRLDLVRAQFVPMVVAPTVGAVVGGVSALLLACVLGLPRALMVTLFPKSVTTAIAMPIAERLGGVPSLTAAVVVVTGVFGMAFGPCILNCIGLRSPLARGAALGTAAHGVGTAKAIEEGPLAGTVASLAMIVAGVVTSLIAPLVPVVLDRLLD
ncbi:MAG: CidB/LrgB family autolysis modulator [Polyangiales bacterium]